MSWLRLQRLKSQRGRPATCRSNADRSSSSTGSSSSEASSITSNDSSKTQTAPLFKVPKWASVAKDLASHMLETEFDDGDNGQSSRVFKTPKWAFAAKDMATRVLDSGESFVRRLPPKRLRHIHTPQDCAIPPVDDYEQERNTVTRNSSKTLCADEEEPHDGPLDFASPTPTWDIFDLSHLSHGDNPEYPVFSGWAAFNGTRCPPRMVPSTYWDDIVARNRQARLEEIRARAEVEAGKAHAVGHAPHLAHAREKGEEPVHTHGSCPVLR